MLTKSAPSINIKSTILIHIFHLSTKMMANCWFVMIEMINVFSVSNKQFKKSVQHILLKACIIFGWFKLVHILMLRLVLVWNQKKHHRHNQHTSIASTFLKTKTWFCRHRFLIAITHFSTARMVKGDISNVDMDIENNVWWYLGSMVLAYHEAAQSFGGLCTSQLGWASITTRAIRTKWATRTTRTTRIGK